MCLDTLDAEVPARYKKLEYGWKAFSVFGAKPGELMFQNYGLSMTSYVPHGVWLTADQREVKNTYFDYHLSRIETDFTYTSGFHVFTTRKAANDWGGSKIVKVKIRGITYSGTQEGHPVLIARQVLVPRAKKKKAKNGRTKK
jgi:hypothetical protein